MVRDEAWALAVATMLAGSMLSCVSGPGYEDLELQRLETAICDKAVSCGCLPPADALCGGWPPEEPFFMQPSSEERSFDPACVEPWLHWVERFSCESPALPRYGDLCPLYHGSLPLGAECFGVDFISTECGKGLLCINDECRDPQLTAFGEQGAPCELGFACNDDQLRCVANECRALPAIGESCLSLECASGAVCDVEDQRCIAAPEVGEPCVFNECGSEAFCEMDLMTGDQQCARLRDVGEPCRGHPECRSGNCPVGICEDPAGPGDPCSNRLPCGEGTACVENVCQPFEPGDVPAGSACGLLDDLRF